jgi:hypothetical protein
VDWSPGNTHHIVGYLSDVPESEIFTVPAPREGCSGAPVLGRDRDGFRVFSRMHGGVTRGLIIWVDAPVAWCVRSETYAV